MKQLTRWSFIGFLLLLTACFEKGGGNHDSVTETGNPSMNTYATTSVAGDFGIWKVTSDSFQVNLQGIDPTSGSVQDTFELSGTCGTPTTFGFKPCTVVSYNCIPGTVACPSVSDISQPFYLLEMPGVSVMIYSPATNQFHSGVVLGDCSSSLAGDYTYTPTALGSFNLFGMFRSDANFSEIVHADFALAPVANPELLYTTLDGGGTGKGTLPSGTCNNGVRQFTLNGVQVRSAITGSGLMMTETPGGSGGSLAFRKDLAASITDIANKTMYGFVGDDTGHAAMVRLQMGAQNGSKVPYSNVTTSSGTVDLTGLSIESAKSTGSLYGFDGVPPGLFGLSYGNNLMSQAYPTPGDIPGLFVTANSSAPDSGLFVNVMKGPTGKIIFFGVGYDNRSGVIKTTSSFIFFETE